MDRQLLTRRSCIQSLTHFTLTRPNSRRVATTARGVNWLSPGTWTHLSADMFEAFRDRKEAGQYLGRELLRSLPSLLQQQSQEGTCADRQQGTQQHGTPAAVSEVKLEDVVVLGLARGGVPVADAVSHALHCSCDALVVRKVGAPLQPEFGIGAIAEGGHVIINEAAVESVGASQHQLRDIVDRETRELQRRVHAYRRGQPHLPVAGKVVVLVDDGLATGVTARAACEAMRASGAAAVVLAVPVGSAHTVAELQQQHVADIVVCLRTPKRFRAVGGHYLDFSQTTDEEVIAILGRHPHPESLHTAAVPAADTAETHHHTAASAQPPFSPQAAAATAGPSADTGSGPLAGTLTSSGAVRTSVSDKSKAATPPAAALKRPPGLDISAMSGQGPAVSDQEAASPHAHHHPATPTQTSTLAAALHRSPAASPIAATAAAPAAAAGAGAAAVEAAAVSLRPVSREEVVIIDSELGVQLHGSLTVPEGALGLVVFAHGSGSSRNSPRNRQVAATLNRAGLATLLFDLLSEEEAQNRHNVFDIGLLASRLQLAVEWMEAEGTHAAGKCPPDFPLGFFGASTGGGAALWAAAYMGPRISAVVVRGGRPDLAAAKLFAVTAPTLLLVGGEDTHVLEYNNVALQMMGSSDSSTIVVVPGAGHLFEGPGQLETVADLAVEWFRSRMGADGDE